MGNRNLIYASADNEKQAVLYTGITLSDFLKHLHSGIDNILLLKGDYVGEKVLNNFELIEGTQAIESMVKEYKNGFGDLCFIDYEDCNQMKHMTDDQIAELLFLAHMFKPKTSPFYDLFNNRFVYLSHDDGFYCKLYCRNIIDFLDVLCAVITDRVKCVVNSQINDMSDCVKKDLLGLINSGMLLDFEDIKADQEEVLVKLYNVGKYTDMDEIINNSKRIKENANYITYLSYSFANWKTV